MFYPFGLQIETELKRVRSGAKTSAKQLNFASCKRVDVRKITLSR